MPDQHVEEQFEVILVDVIDTLQHLNSHEFYRTCLISCAALPTAKDFCEIQVDQYSCEVNGFVWVCDNNVVLWDILM